MTTARRNNTKAIAKRVKDKIRKEHPRSGSYSIETIMAIKRCRDADMTIEMIVGFLKKAKSTVANICTNLNQVEMVSPEMKGLAVQAARKILEEGDDNNKIKIIDRVFPQDKTAKEKGISININPYDKSFENKDYKYEDVEGY